MEEKKKVGKGLKALAAVLLSVAAVSTVGLSVSAFAPGIEEIVETTRATNESPDRETTPEGSREQNSQNKKESEAATTEETQKEGTLIYDDGKVRIYDGPIPDGESPPLYTGEPLSEDEIAEMKPNTIDPEDLLGYEEMKTLSPSERVDYYNAVNRFGFRLYLYPDELGLDMALPLDEKYLPDGWAINSYLCAEEDSDIYAVADGTVVYANEYGNYLGYGNTVVLEHKNGYASFYAPLKEIYVKTGDRVEKGDLIGTLADWYYGDPFEPNLTFELYKDKISLTRPNEAPRIGDIYDYLALVKSGNTEYEDLNDFLDREKLDPESREQASQNESEGETTETAAKREDQIISRILKIFPRHDVNIPDLLADQDCAPLDPGEVADRFVPVTNDAIWFKTSGAAKIYAAADGTVVFADEVFNYGLTIIIRSSDGLYRCYGNCNKDRPFVSAGESVKAGDVIGYTGTTRWVTDHALAFFLADEDRAGLNELYPALTTETPTAALPPNISFSDELLLGYEEEKQLSPLERVAYYNAISSQKWDFRLYIYPDELGLDMTLPLDEKYFPNGWEFNAKQLYGEFGCNIYAAAAGTVVYASEYGRYGVGGSIVLIEHGNGYATLYGHFKPNDVKVKTGDRVEKGQLLGTLANEFVSRPYIPNFDFDIYKDHLSLTMPEDSIYGLDPIYEYLALREEGKDIYGDLGDFMDDYKQGG
ncbi:MAG: M23 family metallopeptidase [Bacteroides sp.]|nr:M23 family metallopeptidase [Eubacterium sp.]MCM1419533.1 M23 family metallopeptidase [Roseburia sp.]MCM1461540.1 M23 family metallopeptidase [Bacteroides sp.]